MSSFNLEIKERGRIVLPARLRLECGFDTGSRLVIRALGPGQAIVESAEAVAERIWAGVPKDHGDGVEALRQWRAADSGRAHKEPAGGGDAYEVGGELLHSLGID